MPEASINLPESPVWFRMPPAPEGRPVTGPEIVQLEAQGCSCTDWAGISVPTDFDPSTIRNVHFSGQVRLGRLHGEVLRGGVAVPAGLYDSVIVDTCIGSGSRVSRIGLLANARIGPGALVSDCGEILGAADSTFGNGIRVGLHTSNADRSLPVVADMPFELVARLARPRPAPDLMALVDGAVDGYTAQCSSGSTMIGAGAVVTGCRRITGSYIAAGCIVSGAESVAFTTLLSDGDARARIGAGAIVRNSLLQWNAVAEDGAFVENSLLCEASAVTRHGIVTASAIGPNTSIAEGEVSASVLGPFTGFNHQALLVSACWPEGRGNVGYGANVGSNHTGRAPDQEIHPGEGAFFGLGVNIKMPADFVAAPYTIVATGVNTPPQRLEMPFSLIVARESPGALNRLIPGWGLSQNLYGIARNIWKFESRNRAARHRFNPDAFRPATMGMVARALQALKEGGDSDTYTEREIPGLGKNLLAEDDRVAGIAAYASTLRWYGLREYFRAWVSRGVPPQPSEVAYLSDFVGADDPGVLLELYLRAEQDRLAAILTSKAKDDSRGARTIEDYVQVHTAAADDPLYLWARDRFEETESRAAELRQSV